MPKPITPTHPSTADRRHIPLVDDILAAGHLRSKSAKRKSRSDDEGANDYIDARASKRILQIGQELAEEDATELWTAVTTGVKINPAFDFKSRFVTPENGSEDGSEDDDAATYGDDQWGDNDEEVEEVELDPDDLDMFHKFIPRGDDEDPIFDPQNPGEKDGEEGTNLADLILEKIAAYEAAQAGQQSIQGAGPTQDAVQIPAKAVEVYQKVGFLLSRYKSGPLPKPFKIIPSLPHWQTLLSLTRPESWTPNAVYAATKIFISSRPQVAQEFISVVLLDRVRDDIHETKKLHVHIYNALKKALYKPACFFKGLLFPLVSSGTCTLREAHIISSIIARVSIPVLHSAAALLRLCEIIAEQTSYSLSSEGTGAANIFIRVFLEKKYALPYKVIDSLVFHFLRFRAFDPLLTAGSDHGDMAMTDAQSVTKSYKLPVLWHQCLLAFAQRYRNDITEDQRESLLDLLLVRGHKDISPEVRRELLAGRGRGVVIPEGVSDQGMTVNDGDDTMDVKMWQ